MNSFELPVIDHGRECVPLIDSDGAEDEIGDLPGDGRWSGCRCLGNSFGYPSRDFILLALCFLQAFESPSSR